MVREGETDLNARGIEVQDADLGANVTQDPELDAVVERSVSDQIGGVGLKQIDSIDGDGGDDLPYSVCVLEEPGHGGLAQWDPAVHDGEPGLAVPDPDLVRVHGGEEHADAEREGGGCRVLVGVGGCGGGGGGIG